MKQLFNLLLILCLTPFGLSAQSLSQAEALFAKEDFTAAKAQYAQVIEKSSGPENFKHNCVWLLANINSVNI